MSFLSERKRALLRWGNDRLWHRWPVMLWPLIKKFKRDHGFYPSLLRPRSLSEKVLYRMLFDRRQFLHTLSGKLESREVVKKRLGNEDVLIPLIGVIREPDDIDKIKFPSRFVMKANQGSDMNYIHTSDNPPDLEHLKKLCREWMACNFAKYNREWCYVGVKQVVMVEAFLQDENGDVPRDYKFFCYDGVPRYIKVDCARFTAHTSDVFDLEWNKIPGRLLYPNSSTPILPPPHLKEMIAIATKLSQGLEFIRVDLYDVGGQVKFGELTNTPARATEKTTPHTLDQTLGNFWKLSPRRELNV